MKKSWWWFKTEFDFKLELTKNANNLSWLRDCQSVKRRQPARSGDVLILTTWSSSEFYLLCVHSLQLYWVVISLKLCKWSRSQQGWRKAFSARNIFSYTNLGAYYFSGSEQLWTAESPTLKDSWRRGYQGIPSRLEVSVILQQQQKKKLYVLRMHYFNCTCLACCGQSRFISVQAYWHIQAGGNVGDLFSILIGKSLAV